MATSPDTPAAPPPTGGASLVIRLVAGILLLGVAAWFTLGIIEGLKTRRNLRTELAEISHVRYGILNPNSWVEKMLPIIDAKIDALDLTTGNEASLKPTVVNALNRLLDDVKEKMSAPPPPPKPDEKKPAGLAALLPQGNPMIANMMIGALKPHVPEYADVVLKELGKPDTKLAIRKYVRSVLADAAKTTFGNIDMRYHDYILKEQNCPDTEACQQVIGGRVQELDGKLLHCSLVVLGSSALAFVVLLSTGVVGPAIGLVSLGFCVVLLLGGVLSPMLEVEASITRFNMTFLGQPISFHSQVLYYQSKSVLEVFKVLVEQGRPDMWIVGVLVLMFSVVFPIIKIVSAVLCLFWPTLLRVRVVKFFVLDSSKWSMADVMALAIFMSFVAFNGLIANSMAGMKQTGADLALPTDSSKLLPGYYLFIGFCLASLFLSKKLEKLHSSRR